MDVFNLAAKLTLDSSEYDRDLGKAEENFSVFGDVLKGNLATEAIVKGLNFVASAAQKAAEGLFNLVKDSVVAFSEYEQLTGGAELMFGEAYDYVMKKSQNAYQNVQMSQTDYLRQVNSFATGLKTSLGGNERAAAELADKIITAEADIVAATGNSQDAVQNAFNGIMKSNYMMLDNLQLGIKPTKEGMQEVIDKVNEWNAAQGRLTNYTMDSLADQEAALVDYVEMVGMSGYASQEASKTIQGSVASTKAAWENLLIAIGTGENTEQAFDSFVKSFDNMVDNIIPVLERIIPALGEIINKIVPLIDEYMPTIINKILPLVTSAIEIIGGALLNMIGELLIRLGNFILEKLKYLFQAQMALYLWVLDQIYNLVVQAVTTVVEFIQRGFQNIADFFRSIWDMIVGVFSGIGAFFVNVFSNAVSVIYNTFSGIGNFFTGIWQSVTGIFSSIGETIIEHFRAAWDWISNIDWSGVGSNIITGIVNGINNFGHYIWDTLRGWAENAWENVKAFFRIGSPSKLMEETIGKWIPLGIAEGIEDEGNAVSDALADVTNLDAMSLDYNVKPSLYTNFSDGIIGNRSTSYANQEPIVINIYPTESQNAKDIAREVERILTLWQRQKKAAFA